MVWSRGLLGGADDQGGEPETAGPGGGVREDDAVHDHVEGGGRGVVETDGVARLQGGEVVRGSGGGAEADGDVDRDRWNWS